MRPSPIMTSGTAGFSKIGVELVIPLNSNGHENSAGHSDGTPYSVETSGSSPFVTGTSPFDMAKITLVGTSGNSSWMAAATASADLPEPKVSKTTRDWEGLSAK